VSAALFWFRNDLRLADNAALRTATSEAQTLLPVYVHDPLQDAMTPWG
jgi:deoxyribodipyrimidine photo-lyase